MNTLVQCDCCDYFTIAKGGDYEICPVCFWEQDWGGVSKPNQHSAANHGLMLSEGRRNFQSFGACLERFKNKVISPTERGKYSFQQRIL
ncbi:CPCC family cysteine-rich protein [Collimonas rhizosphaerae]|uniref:CPCC family cysteine-rich protein n=1 Tax=Collimonas rhizosphaerae TaxID=3126357 RepID=UPI003CCC4ABD